MGPPRWFPFLILAVILLFCGTLAGVWWYLNGPVEIESADLVPANSVFFASIPNAAEILEGYQTSKLKTLLESPNAKPLQDMLVNMAGKKNADLVQSLLPNLSGQSFVAITHFDYDHPEQIGLIAGMKPKPGLGDFDGFIAKLKDAWPDVVKQGHTGSGSVEGSPYDWIQGPGASDKICVAKVDGWIITTWGEASLRDWLERYHHKPTTSSLAQDVNYEKAVSRVGSRAMGLAYVNLQLVAAGMAKQADKLLPGSGNYLTQKFQAVGGAAVATRFENGDIVDRYSFIYPRPAQLDSGMTEQPCSFETLNFTGPDTRFYWAGNIDWKRYYSNLKAQTGPSVYNQTGVNPTANNSVAYIKNWVHAENLDAQRNIVDALGPEVSVQAEWSADDTYPQAGLFVKVDKPDDFKPTIHALIDTVRKAYANSGVIQELAFRGHNFAALQFFQTSPITPTITEDGPYFGVFLTENQAVRSFQREADVGLLHRPEFNAQIGDKRTGAAQICFLDTPYLLNRAYQTAMPYLSFAAMFDKNIGAFLRGQNLPPDLTWLAPMATWSCVITPDEEGIQAYSVSGIGNQGALIAAAFSGGESTLQTMGYLPRMFVPPPAGAFAPPTHDPAGAAPAAAPSIGAAAVPLNGAPTQSVIYIAADSSITFDQTSVPLAQIGDFLKGRKSANPNLAVSVKVNPDALPDTLSAVMDAATAAGFGVPPYSYEAESPGAPAAPIGSNVAAGTNSPVAAGSPSSVEAPPVPAPPPVSGTPEASPLAPAPGNPDPSSPPINATNANANPQSPGPLRP